MSSPLPPSTSTRAPSPPADDVDEDEGLFQMFTSTMRFDAWFKDFLAVYSKDPLLDQVAGKQIIIDAIQDDDQKSVMLPFYNFNVGS